MELDGDAWGLGYPRVFWPWAPAGMSLRPFAVASPVLARRRNRRSDPSAPAAVLAREQARETVAGRSPHRGVTGLAGKHEPGTAATTADVASAVARSMAEQKGHVERQTGGLKFLDDRMPGGVDVFVRDVREPNYVGREFNAGLVQDADTRPTE